MRGSGGRRRSVSQPTGPHPLSSAYLSGAGPDMEELIILDRLILFAVLKPRVGLEVYKVIIRYSLVKPRLSATEAHSELS